MSSGRSHQSATTDGYGELHRRDFFLSHPTDVPKNGVHYGGYRLEPAGRFRRVVVLGRVQLQPRTSCQGYSFLSSSKRSATISIAKLIASRSTKASTHINANLRESINGFVKIIRGI